MSMTPLERLAARIAENGAPLCAGIDPVPERLPAGIERTAAGVAEWGSGIVAAVSPHVAAIKLNLAFYEALGAEGWRALERVRASVPSELIVIADAKRGDIGTTTARQAVALYDVLEADAVTVNPYLGATAVAPFLERGDRFAYLLCRTSNPGAGEVQDLVVAEDPVTGAPREPLHERVARLATGWGPGGTVGLVVGATAPSELAAIRAIAPALAFLVPGIGAQGGDVAPVLASGPATAPPASVGAGRGLLVNVSRGIAGAAAERAPGASADPFERVAAAAADWSARLPVLP
jgi:orotidine-5'-phosphate decarboxylase